MKNKLLIFLWILAVGVFGQESKKVFFIGNSYTAAGNIPGLIQQIAESTNDELIYSAHTPGGATFQQHASNSNVISTIQEGDWDYVVLQEQSQLPSFPMEEVEVMVLPYAEQLSNMIYENNPCAQVAFYMTWGRKNGDTENCGYWPPVCTYEGMDDLLYDRYMLMADINDAVVSPVGRVWRYIRENYPDVELYSGDGSHPSAVGSMAVAYTFYTAIFKKSPYESDFTGSISSGDMEAIKEAVQEVVFEDLNTWHLWDYLPYADFSYIQNDLEVSFENHSENAENYYWDFGDGSFSEEENPIHEFNCPGIYMTTLTIEKCGETDAVSELIDLSEMNSTAFDSHRIKVYPNPVKDILIIESENKIENFEFFNVSGKRIHLPFETKDGSLQIETRSLIHGTYFLKIKTLDEIKEFKILKN